MVTVAMFRSMGLDSNLNKTKALVCTPGFIWEKWWKTAYNQQATEEGVTFRESKRTRTIFTECSVTVAAL